MTYLSKINLHKVVGHRGASGYAPENTMAAMHKAYDLGIQWVEFDVMLSQDGEAIIFHDATLNRTTNGRGKVAKTNYSEIKKLDAGSWFDKSFAGEHVPTFKELLHFLHRQKMNINVEIKPTRSREEMTAHKTVKFLEEFWPCHDGRLIVSSFSSTALTAAYAANPRLPFGYLLDKWNKNWQQLLDKFDCVSLHANYKALTQDRVELVKRTGRAVLAYTVNDPTLAATLFSWGVDSVFSDYPDRV